MLKQNCKVIVRWELGKCLSYPAVSVVYNFNNNPFVCLLIRVRSLSFGTIVSHDKFKGHTIDWSINWLI